MNTLILFPNQLIHTIPSSIKKVIMIEHSVFFNNKMGNRPYAKLNRIRCAYHRASTEIWVQS